MNHATFRFYAELNDFLSPQQRQKTLTRPFDGAPAVKDAIEALGVPHTEVELILANGHSVDFSYAVRDGDRIAVYPVFEALDVTPLLRVRPEPLREVRFVADVHLGRLAAWLRLAGFDTRYGSEVSDPELARTSRVERRILLTRDRGLLKRSEVTHGYCVRSSVPQEQLVEILGRFDLAGLVRPFVRCLRCNALLKPVEKQCIADRLPARTRTRHQRFRRCSGCDRIYWEGSHHARLQALLDEAMATVGVRG